MYLFDLLNPKAIIHESRILAKEQVYQMLVERICKHYKLPIDKDALLNMVLERDELSSTAYPTGISIPHIRMEDFDDTVVGMAFLQNPLDYDGTKVHWVCLVITDKSSSNLYLNLVAALLKISKDAELVAALMDTDGFGVVQKIKHLEILLKKEITIADVMITDVISIPPEVLLSELSDILCSSRLSYIPVTDEAGHYLGEVNILHLLKVGVPDYLMMLDDVSFLRSYEPLEHLFEQQDLLRVGEIMHNSDVYLKPQASIPEAVFEMIQHHKRFYSVVDDAGLLVGVITAMDIFRKVIKA
jgi:nitrogen PTS system EIIA component